MNDCIKELSNKAWEYAHRNSQDGDGMHGWLYRDKFAELIIKECIEQIHGADVGDLKAKGYYLDKVAEHIEKHFGIE